MVELTCFARSVQNIHIGYGMRLDFIKLYECLVLNFSLLFVHIQALPTLFLQVL